jgi:hypothetical protein
MLDLVENKSLELPRPKYSSQIHRGESRNLANWFRKRTTDEVTVPPWMIFVVLFHFPFSKLNLTHVSSSIIPFIKQPLLLKA